MSRVLLRFPIITSVLFAIVASYPLFLAAAYAVRIQEDLGASKSQWGWAAAAYFAAGAIGSYRLGRLVDRFGTRFGGIVASVGGAVSLLIIGLASRHWLVIVVALALTGFANVAGQLAGNRIIAAYVDEERQGFGFGAKQAAVPLGAFVAGLVAATAVGTGVAWRTVFTISAVASISLAILAPEFGAAPRIDGRQNKGVGADAKSLVALSTAGALFGATGNALAVLVVDAFESAGFSASTAAGVLAFGSAAAILGRVVIGWVVDRRGSNGFAELVVIVSLGVVGFSTLAIAGASVPLLVVGVGLGFAAGWGWPAIIYFVTARNSTASPATSTGFVLTGVFFGAVIGPPLMATIAERASYTAAWATAAVLTALGVVGVFFSWSWSVGHNAGGES